MSGGVNLDPVGAAVKGTLFGKAAGASRGWEIDQGVAVAVGQCANQELRRAYSSRSEPQPSTFFGENFCSSRGRLGQRDGFTQDQTRRRRGLDAACKA